MLLHFRGHEARKAKKAKEEQLALRRGASKVAREVRGFWGKLNKVCCHCHFHLRADAGRRPKSKNIHTNKSVFLKLS